MALNQVIEAYNRKNGPRRPMSPEELAQYGAELELTRVMFRGLASHQPEINGAGGWADETVARIHYRPVDMGMRMVGGIPRQVLIQPTEKVYTHNCQRDYPEATPDSTAGYELGVFAVVGDKNVNPDDLEEALWDSERLADDELGVEFELLGSEHIFVVDPEEEPLIGAMEDVRQFNVFLREVIDQAILTPTA